MRIFKPVITQQLKFEQHQQVPKSQEQSQHFRASLGTIAIQQQGDAQRRPANPVEPSRFPSHAIIINQVKLQRCEFEARRKFMIIYDYHKRRPPTEAATILYTYAKRNIHMHTYYMITNMSICVYPALTYVPILWSTL